MTTDALKTLIKTTLNIPVYEDATSITYPSATIECYRHDARLVGDGHAVKRVSVYQLDLWYTSRASLDAATALMTSALDLAEVTPAECDSRYDTTAKKFRTTYHFETI